ncbi:MAG: amidase family protein [Arcanobacterium sp.]|nr:amidase family protein [Arcanobacterium sp.]
MAEQNTFNWQGLDIPQWREAVQKFGATAATKAALNLIATKNPTINAFVEVFTDSALKRAAELDQLPVKEQGPLHGIPIAIKDENDIAGSITGYGTGANSNPAKTDALTVSRLRDAGAIIIGKTTMPALGAFPMTESKAHGITRNPLNLAYTPGGSSGGSAAAVAAGIVPAALGGDGGGSIRIPADRCGLVGLKPGRGVIPTSPKKHLWFKLGTAGPICRTAADAFLLHVILSGRYENTYATPQISLPNLPQSLRIAVITKSSSPLSRVHPEHRKAVENIGKLLENLGHDVDYLDSSLPDPTTTFLPQFFAGLCETISGLDHPEKIEKLHKHTLRYKKIATGTALAWSLAAADKYREKLEKKFADYDLLLTPTTAARPALVGTLAKRGGFLGAMIRAIPSVVFTVPGNVSGHAAIAIPAGIADDGLPLSTQLIACGGRRKKNKDDAGETAEDSLHTAEDLLCAVAQQIALAQN